MTDIFRTPPCIYKVTSSNLAKLLVTVCPLAREGGAQTVSRQTVTLSKGSNPKSKEDEDAKDDAPFVLH